jgi:GTP cyclohydrolase I
MVIESHISIQSMCEHHFLPILGYCHVAYIPGNKIIGLSKLNRIAQFFAKRPQVQERMTKQIRKSLAEVLETSDVIVVVDALHLCVRMRGIQDHDSMTRTYDCSGVFENSEQRQHFFSSIPRLNEIKLS